MQKSLCKILLQNVDVQSRPGAFLQISTKNNKNQLIMQLIILVFVFKGFCNVAVKELLTLKIKITSIKYKID